MALRGRIPDAHAVFPDPVLGVNLYDSPENLGQAESPYMQNCILVGGRRTRRGSTRLTPAALATGVRVLGGHKFYAESGVGYRLVAYGSTIALVADNGTQTVLTSGNTANLDTYFTTWSITDKVYVANGVDELAEYDGTTYRNVSAIGGAQQVPGSPGFAPAVQVIPVLDRLLAITSRGIERSGPREAWVWSHDSPWATLRPSRSGQFIGGIPHSLVGSDGTVQTGLLAMQDNAYYWVSATNFGEDVTAATDSSEDSVIRLIDPSIGGIGPRSMTSVPGLGAFWLTSELDLYFVPQGQGQGLSIGKRITSNSATAGLNHMNLAERAKAFVISYGQYLRVGFPVGGNNFPTVQYWLDLDKFRLDQRVPVWYGPMLGQSPICVWRETQGPENQLVAAEGNPTVGAFVYILDVDNEYTDAVGLLNPDIEFECHSYYKTFGAPSREKLIAEIELELNEYEGTATLDLADLEGPKLTGIPIERVRL